LLVREAYENGQRIIYPSGNAAMFQIKGQLKERICLKPDCPYTTQRIANTFAGKTFWVCQPAERTILPAVSRETASVYLREFENPDQ
jgi:hypothetical protein